MGKLMEGVLVMAIVGIVGWYAGDLLWQAGKAAHPPPEPTALDQVRECGYEGRRSVRTPTAECGEVFNDALRQLGAQQFVLAVGGLHQAGDLCARGFVEMDVAGRAAMFAGWAAPLPPSAQRVMPAHTLIQMEVRNKYRCA
ncbi:MAG: hypothetical protein OXH15_11345 [Gammaproteobacteria bacterium]|nr:hypothetical protein [Gammaproteobacteria bacterium]